MIKLNDTSKPKIGCIGLGYMGRPIANHLIKAGYDVYLYARRPEVFEGECKSLIAAGAQSVSSMAELASLVDIVLVNVMAGQDVRQVVLGHQEDPKNTPIDASVDCLIKGAKPGLLIIDHSTIDPSTAIDLHQQLQAKQIHFIDAPVSGGSIGAEAGSLAIMMGGDADAIDQAMPIISHYSKTQRHMGKVGTGQITKLCNQIAQIITIQGVAEAMQFAGAYGADQNAVMDVLASGFASSRMLELMAPKMIAEDFSPLMKSQLLHKDAGIAQSASQDKGLAMPALDLVAKNLAYLQEQGWHEQDVSILINALKK